MENKTPNPQAFANEYDKGMSLRDYFAAQAMQGLLSNPEILDDESLRKQIKNKKWNALKVCSYDIAQAMLEERKNRIGK